ncbi:hybrid sensor histidine kinase/response regulator [Skermanella aerolata]|uniref:histidine kinase n=1 Tax=Skermanella aerolata TaxID=393310 RepID=A0A512DKN8_9PROT|nr:NahK/ErcS family hybrid sensor histidine kinase/response regulator [Skermanella aerolata]KJB97039.1 histidine kinase [Skermanella aerolata KACC 11604]GEO36770.1 hybrid sensor histidine kinase/response regulator [Skermanella aerolata]
METWVVALVSLGTLLVLFAVAWQGDRWAASGRPPTRAPLLYTLSLAVYCTSWTFYGSVGRASVSGFDFLPIYLGPILMLGLGWPVLARLVRIAKAENTVSISDFLSARYGKSRAVAALVTVTAVIGVMPYLALQLKAITISFEALTGADTADRLVSADTVLLVTASMAVFSILFGVRNIHATEHHRGLVLAVAFESLVKLAAFLVVGIVVTFAIMGGPAELWGRVAADPRLSSLMVPDLATWSWWTMTLLSAFAILCLPRQFHVAVVENVHVDDVRTAARLFPLYLIIINLFVMPVALAGVLLFPDGTVSADTFMVSIPMAEGWPAVALIAFIGGLSAATGMIIVAAVTLSTMLCNDVVVPGLMRIRPGNAAWRDDPARMLLVVRRSAVVGILALAYGFHRVIGETYPLTTIGLVSFAAVAQFAPALFGAILWRRGNRAGAIGGIAMGFAVWAYTALVPSVADAGWIDAGLVVHGPLGIGWLNPRALIGWPGPDPLTHSVMWSLGLNLTCYVGLSLTMRQGEIERQQAERFVGMGSDGTAPALRGMTRIADLHALAARYVGFERADAVFAGRPGWLDKADAEAVRQTENLLAGALGSASARVVVAGMLKGGRLSQLDARSMLDEASKAILANHDLLRTTLESIAQGICVVDRANLLATWNRRFVELNQLPNGLLKAGMPLSDVKALIRPRNDGTELEVATHPMPDGGFVITYTDVTERSRAAMELREANESLERRIGERTADLLIAKAEAERANQGKTRFLAAAGHDLMQPLHAARLFLSALAERSGDPLVGQTDASLRSVEELLGELLDVSKLDSGVVTAKPLDFRIDELLGPLKAEFTAQAGAHGLGFRMVGSTAGVRSDPALLRRILRNLLSNAIRYTGSGRVLLGCRRGPNTLRIEVWDTGIGIPPDKLEDIFIEFRQLEDAPAERGKGLGLGLSIVERLAGILGHSVSVRSTHGRGSCFAIEVPLAAGPVSAPRTVPQRRARNFNDALVLCIDNDPAVVQGMETLLTGWGCRVLAASDGASALAVLDGRVPQAILSDYHLDRGATGIEILEELARHFGSPVPTALITADRSGAIQAEAAERGYAVAHKPIRPGALKALVSRLTAGHRPGPSSSLTPLPALPAPRAEARPPDVPQR